MIIPFVLTSVHAAEPEDAIFCPGTHVAIDGKCQPANYINPLYYYGSVIGVIGLISIIFIIKKNKAA